MAKLQLFNTYTFPGEHYIYARDRLIVVSCEKGGSMMTYMYF
jgi:hypothetical protein